MSESETFQQLHDRRDEIERHLSTIIEDELSPELRHRVRRLLHDLATNDFPMTLFDLAQLSRVLTTGTLPKKAQSFAHLDVGMMPILIYGEESEVVTAQCSGPDASGACPRAKLECPVPCSGAWVMASGWRFRVAQDAECCPVATLFGGPSRPSVGSPATTPDDVFASEAGEASAEESGDLVEEAYQLID
jgi:hypothetical protein